LMVNCLWLPVPATKKRPVISMGSRAFPFGWWVGLHRIWIRQTA
jgi:hypothetical protein